MIECKDNLVLAVSRMECAQLCLTMQTAEIIRGMVSRRVKGGSSAAKSIPFPTTTL
eukprot:SAG31_NODE_1539_length_7970_cov_5.655571_6_plen_56_part_00